MIKEIEIIKHKRVPIFLDNSSNRFRPDCSNIWYVELSSAKKAIDHHLNSKVLKDMAGKEVMFYGRDGFEGRLLKGVLTGKSKGNRVCVLCEEYEGHPCEFEMNPRSLENYDEKIFNKYNDIVKKKDAARKRFSEEQDKIREQMTSFKIPKIKGYYE